MVGLAEQPDGSNNAPPVTTWWGLQGPWCNMTESYAWAQSGWSADGGRTLDMPGVVQQKPGKGWARVDLMVQAFKAAGRYGLTPKVGAAFHVGTGDGAHTGLVARVNANGTVDTIEGNYQNRLARVTRTVSSIRGYCYPDYVPAVMPTSNEEDPFMALSPDEQAEMRDNVRNMTDELSKLATVLRDPLSGLAERVGDVEAKVDRILAHLGAQD